MLQNKNSFGVVKKLLLLFFLYNSLLISSDLDAQITLRGVVVDNNRTTLPGATICTFPDTTCTVTNEHGAFELQPKRLPRYIEVSYVGFEKKRIQISPLFDEDHFHIVLHPSTESLREITVLEDRLVRDVFQPVSFVGGDFFDERSEGNLAASLSVLPGVNHLNLGLGVGKPVIRGLYANRVIVADQGVKQEGHQWGVDHGLEIDQFRARRIEVLKGPSSLEFGSDGLGGVVRILPDPIAIRNTVSTAFTLLGKSNNDHLGGNLFFSGAGENFFASANVSQQAFSDYRVPTDRFVYNTFELPIFNERLKNTAGKESAFSITTGYRDENNLLRLTASQYRQHAGIFSGAVGIPQSFALQDDGDSRNIEFPSQRVSHQRMVAFYQRKLRSERMLEINLGLQENHRREFSFPEFHAIQDRADINERLALEMELRTISMDASYSSEGEFRLGFNIQHQDNETGGFDYFLPPFRTLRAGVYGYRDFKWSELLRLKAGLRLDYGHNESDEAGRDVWNTSGDVIGQLSSKATDRHFFNYAASLGFIKKFKDNDQLELFGHLGKSFRIPYPVETSSNGVHHGSFRHEIGRPDLDAEHGYQLDIGFRYFSEKALVSLSPFFNYFNDYIYLRPSPEFSPLPDAGQLYRYEQHNAIFSGFEVEWEYQLFPAIKWAQSFESVWSYNLDTRLALPFTPPHSLLSKISYQQLWSGPQIKFSADISHRWVAEQNRVDRNELTTPSYHMLDAGLRLGFQNWLGGVSISLMAHNILDTKYFNHLSRYRQLGIPEQGRNFVVRLHIPFSVGI